MRLTGSAFPMHSMSTSGVTWGRRGGGTWLPHYVLCSNSKMKERREFLVDLKLPSSASSHFLSSRYFKIVGAKKKLEHPMGVPGGVWGFGVVEATFRVYQHPFRGWRKGKTSR